MSPESSWSRVWVVLPRCCVVSFLFGPYTITRPPLLFFDKFVFVFFSFLPVLRDTHHTCHTELRVVFCRRSFVLRNFGKASHEQRCVFFFLKYFLSLVLSLSLFLFLTTYSLLVWKGTREIMAVCTCTCPSIHLAR